MVRLIELLPDAKDLLALQPEELGEILLGLPILDQQPSGFVFETIFQDLYSSHGARYPDGIQSTVQLAIAEALLWMENEGLIVRTPGQLAAWHQLTRRARAIKNPTDFQAFKVAKALPANLLQSELETRVRAPFLRGSYDSAVFEAFRLVEITVRDAANAKGAGYPDDLVGAALMRKAFHMDGGPLTDKSAVAAEREAQMHLFACAIMHAKNPTGHRDVRLNVSTAARLIVFASHLLDQVEIAKST